MKVEHDVQPDAVRFGHPQVEHLQRGLAQQLRIAARIDIAQFIDRCVVECFRNERYAHGIETEALDLCDLFLPAHCPKILRLQYRRVETEVTDAADLDFLAVGFIYFFSVRHVVAGSDSIAA